MKRLMVLMLLWCTPVLACGSYEECIEKDRDLWTYSHGAEYTLKAIAYKLADIEKAIKESNNPTHQEQKR